MCTKSMARFAAGVLGVAAGRHQARVRGGRKIARDFFVAGCALCGTDKLRARNAGRREDRASGRAAGKHNDGKSQAASA